jgi:hypothetical protein
MRYCSFGVGAGSVEFDVVALSFLKKTNRNRQQSRLPQKRAQTFSRRKKSPFSRAVF